MKQLEKDFSSYRSERILKECPVCSDLYHGYKEGRSFQAEKIKKLQAENKKLRECVVYTSENAPRRFAVKAQKCLEELEGQE